ncbi:hypothetical protein [Flammeovirga kamogawensis]|uniref:Ig-like domain-containing protein n=1 Tax=Flammeovirga kamogawensis TaxID=373891 RepID=A0ABX8GVU3_9BACT|nr:hypothetical protein [Flammeovirga kamogawensis]MBB6461538.1 hypothetical protein [Flammeovirga kamogawensis]QWG07529.1 hypothetical protein KM029_00920 [Flammeovirga kamogawensis]TRX69343.1 hypothetical protein EO216_14865 [Flammeovirga kamogawensis]
MKIFLLSFLLLFFTQLGWSQSVVSGSISVEGGLEVTNNPEGRVQLKIKYSSAVTHMKISRDESFRGVVWERVNWEKSNYPIIRRGEGDGLKTIYAVFKDEVSGNVSEVSSIMIELDRTPPQNPELLINGGLPFTNNKSRMVTLFLSADEAQYMRIANRPDFYGKEWIPYSQKVDKYKLIGLDGKKEIFAQFKDAAGNESEVISSTITIDITPPTAGKMKINDGEKYLKDSVVTLHFFAEGASHIQIRGGDGWIDYAEEVPWTLSRGDGEKVIYARFRDEVGNYSSIVSARAIVDRVPPRFGRIIIDDGRKFIDNHARHKLQLIIQGATEMKVSNNENFSDADWIPYTPVLPVWNFPIGDGKKTVYVKFRDRAKNESEVFTSFVMLDATPPQNPKLDIVAEGIVQDTANNVKLLKDDKRIVDLQIKADDARFMMIANQQTFFGARWMVYKESVTKWELNAGQDGVRTVYIKFMDRAKNISEVAFDRVVIDTEAPVGGKVTIDNNKEFSIDKEHFATLKLFARKADFMQISNDPTFMDANWEPYQVVRKWKLAGNDGVKTVFARFSDLAGNVSDPVSDNIMLDTKPPFNCTIVVKNHKDGVVNHPDAIALLRVNAEDAVKMQISNHPNFEKIRWIGYSEYNIPWRLPGQDGVKEIYTRFMDEAGNVTDTYSVNVTLDRTPPVEGTVEIDEAKDKLVNLEEVNLTIAAKGASTMRLSSRSDFKGAEWEKFTTNKKWKFPAGDGVKFVYVIFKDEVGNISRPSYASVGVDTDAPREGSILIGQGEKYCTDFDARVRLKLSARGATKMMISNNKGFEGAEWQKFKFYIYDHYLDAEEDGEKTVYAKFKDDAENVTSAVSSSIILDRQEPVNEKLIVNNGEKFTNDKTGRVQLEIFAEGAKEMKVTNDRYFKQRIDWEPYSTSKDWIIKHSSDGEKFVYVKFRDEAGNESMITTGSITLDTTPPIPQFVKIEGGKTAVDSPTVTITTKAREATYMMVSNKQSFAGAIWRPYSEQFSWSLESGPGLKRVFIKFKDNSQNESDFKFAETTLYDGNK